MKIKFGIDGILVESDKKFLSQTIEDAPTAKDICEADKRFIYLGHMMDYETVTVPNAFIHVLEPREMYTITGVRFLDDKTVFLKTERHFLGDAFLNRLCSKYDHEIYVGDICDGSGRTGKVWHDTYKKSLSSNELYTKNEDGSISIVHNKVAEDCYSVPDRFMYRIVVKTPNRLDEHYAFFFSLSAFNQWNRLQYNATEGQKVLHSIEPDYTKFLLGCECREFEQLPELVKAYPESYSEEGYLNYRR